jgi:hypothetical protein
MTDLLNREKLQIYNLYNGDIDGVFRNNRPTEMAVFGDSLDITWELISNKLQDIELISRRLASYDYTKKILSELFEKSDAETFKLFTDKIPFYDDFQNVRHILETIKGLTTDEADAVWAGYDNGKDFLIDLNSDIEKIIFCDFETLDRLNLEFAPTSTYQELSLSNGWTDDYIELSARFDKLYVKIKRQKTVSGKTEWWKFWQ